VRKGALRSGNSALSLLPSSSLRHQSPLLASRMTMLSSEERKSLITASVSPGMAVSSASALTGSLSPRTSSTSMGFAMR